MSDWRGAIIASSIFFSILLLALAPEIIERIRRRRKREPKRFTITVQGFRRKDNMDLRIDPNGQGATVSATPNSPLLADEVAQFTITAGTMDDGGNFADAFTLTPATAPDANGAWNCKLALPSPVRTGKGIAVTVSAKLDNGTTISETLGETPNDGPLLDIEPAPTEPTGFVIKATAN